MLAAGSEDSEQAGEPGHLPAVRFRLSDQHSICPAYLEPAGGNSSLRALVHNVHGPGWLLSADKDFHGVLSIVQRDYLNTFHPALPEFLDAGDVVKTPVRVDFNFVIVRNGAHQAQEHVVGHCALDTLQFPRVDISNQFFGRFSTDGAIFSQLISLRSRSSFW
jgi:hypothetical protein